MLDMPMEHFEQLLLSQQELVPSSYDFSHMARTLSMKAAPPSESELKQIAENYQKHLENGFDWNCFANIINDTYHYLSQWKQLSSEDRKARTLAVLNHFIDITDTPFLPDEYTDPILKALLVPLVDVLDSTLEPVLPSLPSATDTQPTAERLKVFMAEMKSHFSDGMQISDISPCLVSTFKFVGSFLFLDKVGKKECVVKIIDSLIDEMDIPGPNFIVVPIIKRIIHPYIDQVFEKLTFL